MQKQVELTTSFQQAFLPGKDKTSEHSPLFLSSKTDIAHNWVWNNFPPKHLFGMCPPEVLIRNIYSN